MISRRHLYNVCLVSSLSLGLYACTALGGRETFNEYMDDTAITASVKSAILEEPSLHTFQIHVETFQGTVQLSGFVDSEHEARKAEQLAKNTKGVKNVKNNIVVRKRKLIKLLLIN